MKSPSSWLRAVVALVALAALSLSAASTAAAAPKRTADTTTYTSASYLETALGLPDKAEHVIESITYDRFQWQLTQPGTFAYLIGDPATDATFAARAQDVEAAAAAAGVEQVYWFNPNLSGSAKLGNVTLPNLDIRDPDGITSIVEAKADVYGNAWLNLVGRHLGNGIVATGDAGTVTITSDAAKVNDAGATGGLSTKVGNTSGGALFQYANAATAPANVKDSYFFLYDRDRTAGGQPSKIAAWTDLTKQASSASARADVTTAIATRGGSAIGTLTEFAWWKATANDKTGALPSYSGGGIPNLTDADGAAANGGWRVHQITYPELIHLLDTENAKEAVILFGGTWCPNTRPVLPAINRYAQENDVTVFNFDTILDGSIVGGGNVGANPLQVRNQAVVGGVDANPSYLYGELVNRYLNNLKVESTTKLEFYPGGDRSQTRQIAAGRLQVPYLIGYRGKEGDEPYGGVTRQWIHTKADGTYVEYMSLWQWTNPQPNQLGSDPATFPREAPIWAKINSQLAAFTWQTDPETLKVNQTDPSGLDQWILPGEKARVTFTAPATVPAPVLDSTGIPIDATAVAGALADLGASAPANYAAARTALITAETATPKDQNLVDDLRTLVGAWGILQTRKTTYNNIWGSAASPASVAGGAAAVRAAEVFFTGIPDRPPVAQQPQPQGQTPAPQTQVTPAPGTPKPAVKPAVTLRKISKVVATVLKAPTRRAGGRYKITITTPKGLAKATGKVTIKLKKGKVTKTVTGRLSKGTVTVKVPKLAKGTWKVTVSWAGDTTYAAFSGAGKAIKVTR